MRSDLMFRNCGIGSGGFESGNECAKGGGGDGSTGSSGGSAKGGSGSEKQKSHNVKLPADPKRLNKDETEAALSQMGYKLGKLSFEGGQTKYELTAPDGTTTKASATDIKELVYKGSSDPKDQATKIPKGRREMATSYGLETRCCAFERDGNRLSGYAAVYDALSHPLVVRSVNGGKPFTERVARGAFDQSLRGNISLLVGHDRRELLANTKSQRLKLASDERGLAFDVQLPETQRAKDVYALVDSGVLSEMSFGFVVRSDAWKGSERTLTQVDLREVSIVESGAYPQTSAEARTYSPALARLRLRLRALT